MSFISAIEDKLSDPSFNAPWSDEEFGIWIFQPSKKWLNQSRHLESGIVPDGPNSTWFVLSDLIQLERNQNKSVHEERIPVQVHTDLLQIGPRHINV